MTDEDKAIAAPEPTTPVPSEALDKQVEVPSTTGSESVTEPEVPGAQTNPGKDFEELANKKGFKSPDDLAKAYSELEADNTRTKMDNSDLLKAREEGLSSKTDDKVPEITSDMTDDEAKAVLNKHIDEQLESKLRPIQEKQAINDVVNKYPDAPKYFGKMAEHVKNNPKESWESAYKNVKFDDLATEAKQEGRNEAVANQAAKSSAQVEASSVKQSKVDDLKAQLGDKNIPLSEIEKNLPHS